MRHSTIRVLRRGPAPPGREALLQRGWQFSTEEGSDKNTLIT
jgi:hypothetical protein